jgi:hypothetical protein
MQLEKFDSISFFVTMSVNPNEKQTSAQQTESNSPVESNFVGEIKSTENDSVLSILDITDTTQDLPSTQKLAPDPTYNIPQQQEQTRSQLATFLIKIFAGTLGLSLALVISLVVLSITIDKDKSENFDKTTTLVKDLITLVVTSQIGLIGSALGFYFGSRNNDSK